MKTIRLFSRTNLALLALAVLLGGTLLFAGCSSMDSGSSDNRSSDNSGHQHHH